MKVKTKRRTLWYFFGFKTNGSINNYPYADIFYHCEGLRNVLLYISIGRNVPRVWVRFHSGTTRFSHVRGVRTERMIKSVLGIFKIEGTFHYDHICHHMIYTDRRELAWWKPGAFPGE